MNAVLKMGNWVRLSERAPARERVIVGMLPGRVFGAPFDGYIQVHFMDGFDVLKLHVPMDWLEPGSPPDYSQDIAAENTEREAMWRLNP